MKNMNIRSGKILIGVLFVVLAISLFAFTSKTHAVTTGTGGSKLVQVDGRAYAWSSALIASYDSNFTCAKGFGRVINPEDVPLAKFYTNGTAKAGFVTQPTGSGLVDCKNGDNWLSTGLDQWGWNGDYGQFLSDLGYAKGSDGGYGAPGGLFASSASPNQIRDVIKQKSGIEIANPTKDVLYYTIYTDFTLGCEAKPFKATSDASLTANDKIGDTVYIIKDVDPATGAVREMVYKAGKGQGINVTTGAGVMGSNYEYTCAELAAKLNDNTLVNAFSDYWKLALLSGIKPLSGTSALTGDSGLTAPTDTRCEDSVELSFIVCPVVRGADSFTSFVQSILYSLLRINDSPTAFNSLKAGWSQVRIISSSLIVVVALTMIVSQIFSFEFMSAYTVKKVLPRLLIAAILIQLSWFLFTTLISLVNAVGDGVAAILYTPFPVLGNAAINGDALQTIFAEFGKHASTWQFAGGTILLAIGGSAGFAAVGGLMGLLLAAAGIVIASLVAFVVLVLRKVLIMGLLVIAPLALVAWILPGTQKWWEKWWETFSKLLFMYPLIIGMLAFGQIAAWLAAQSAGPLSMAQSNIATVNSHTSFFSQAAAISGEASTMVLFFIILVAYFGPYFFIPSMFKLGGSLFAKATQMATTGGNVLKKSRPYKNLEKGRDNNRARREYDSKDRGQKWAQGGGLVGRTAAGRKYGQFQAGKSGVGSSDRSAFVKQFEASQEHENMKNAADEYSTATKGMVFTEQTDDSVRIATAKVGSTVELQNGNRVMTTEAMQKTAAKFLADTGRSDALRQVEEGLTGTGRGELWNSIKNDNAGAITKVNPEQMGKKYETLSATEMSDMKPESFRNMRAMVADPSIPPPIKAKIRDRLNELYSNETLKGKLGAEALEHVEEILTNPTLTRATKEIEIGASGAPVTKVATQVDAAGRTQHIAVDDGAGGKRQVVNPAFNGADNGHERKP
jgi:hypothetical protein